MTFRLGKVGLENLPEVSKVTAQLFQGGDVVVLVGDIGAGKTTFASVLARELGSNDEVTSPTFAIVAHYKLKEEINGINEIIHVDTYRLTHVNELFDLGVETIFQEHSLTIIEWGERVEDFIDSNYFRIEFDESDVGSRDLTLDFMGEDSERKSSISKMLIENSWVKND